MARRPRPRPTPPDPLELVGEHLHSDVWEEWDAMSAADQQTMLDEVTTWDTDQMKSARAHHWTTTGKRLRPCLAWAVALSGAWEG